MKVYLDNAATTPIRDEVIELMIKSMSSTFGNPSSTHSFGRSAKSMIETARKSIAKHLNCEPQEIIFTSGGTESDNMILRCAVKDLNVKTIVSSVLEHHAVLHPLDELQKEGVNIRYVDLDEDGSPKFFNYHIYFLERSPDEISRKMMYISTDVLESETNIDLVDNLWSKSSFGIPDWE